MQSHQVLWNVSLSNGENFRENTSPFEQVDEELTPWNKLLAYLEEKQLRITALWLTTPNGTRFSLPSSGTRDPRFAPFRAAGPPTRLRCFRSIAAEVSMEVKTIDFEDFDDDELFTVGEAEFYPTHKVQVWVKEKDPNLSWVLAVAI